MTAPQRPTPRTDACQGSDGTLPECDELCELSRELERSLSEREEECKALSELNKALDAKLAEMEAVQPAIATVPEGYKLVCEKCGADQGDKCGWPSNCPVDRRNDR